MATETPTVEQLARDVLVKIKEYQFETGDALVSQSIFIPIYERYDTDDLSDIINLVLESMRKNGYIEEKDGSTILTASGYKAASEM